jgi:hypothetical protein
VNLLYVIGEPGAGKSTLVAYLTRGLWKREESSPFAHLVYACGVVELGRRRAEFGGTDALSMAVQPQVLSWAEMTLPKLVIGEGARLGNLSFMTSMAAIGYDVHLVALEGSEQAALQRRLRGGGPGEDFAKGQRTKVANVIAGWRGRVTRLAVGEKLPMLEARLMADPDPVLLALRGPARNANDPSMEHVG